MHISQTALLMLHEDPNLDHRERSMVTAVKYLRPISLDELSAKTRISRTRTAATCRSLVNHGWLRLFAYGRRLKPSCWVPERLQRQLVEELEDDFDMANFRGEFLAGRLLEFLVDTPRLLSNVRPRFLENPTTGGRLELDRLAPGIVAIEFNGIQHYAGSEEYDTNAVNEAKARDLMKEAMCQRVGLPLIVVKPQDLSLDRMKALLPSSLPFHDIDANEPYARGLERLCSMYARKTAKFR